MYKLITHWDDIDFNKINIRYNKKDNNYTIILLDYNIELLYLHYRFDANAKVYTKRGPDALYYDMENHLLKQWDKHIIRMKDTTPIFTVMQTNGKKWDYTEQELNNIKQIQSKYPIIVWDKKMNNFKAAEFLHKVLKDLEYI